MSLSHQRITSAAMATLREAGFQPDKVPFQQTGKSALELIVDAISQAVLDEITTNGVVKVALDKGLAAWMGNGVPVPQDGGTALQSGLVTAAQGGAYDKATGGIS